MRGVAGINRVPDDGIVEQRERGCAGCVFATHAQSIVRFQIDISRVVRNRHNFQLQGNDAVAAVGVGQGVVVGYQACDGRSEGRVLERVRLTKLDAVAERAITQLPNGKLIRDDGVDIGVRMLYVVLNPWQVINDGVVECRIFGNDKRDRTVRECLADAKGIGVRTIFIRARAIVHDGRGSFGGKGQDNNAVAAKRCE